MNNLRFDRAAFVRCEKVGLHFVPVPVVDAVHEGIKVDILCRVDCMSEFGRVSLRGMLRLYSVGRTVEPRRAERSAWLRCGGASTRRRGGRCGDRRTVELVEEAREKVGLLSLGVDDRRHGRGCVWLSWRERADGRLRSTTRPRSLPLLFVMGAITCGVCLCSSSLSTTTKQGCMFSYKQHA